jgi:sulfur-carrier protein
MVRVLLFARARELVGQAAIDLACGEPTSARNLRGRLAEEFPKLKSLLESAAIAVNETYATEATVIRPGDTVAIIPPVSGG